MITQQRVRDGDTTMYRAARAIIAGFAATGAMTTALLVAYTIMANLSLVLPRTQLRDWFYALTHNSVVDITRQSLAAGALVHIAIGLTLALVYAFIVEPRISGPDWRRGVLFSLIPWVLSLVVFLPLMGGGFLGLAIGAGPLPILGNLILHLVYGATLGVVYGSEGDVVEDLREGTETAPLAFPRQQTRISRHYEMGTAIGIVAGSILGGLIGMMFGNGWDARVPGMPNLDPWTYALAGVFAGAAAGTLIGSFAGMGSEANEEDIEPAIALGPPAEPTQLPSPEARPALPRNRRGAA